MRNIGSLVNILDSGVRIEQFGSDVRLPEMGLKAKRSGSIYV